MECPKSQVMSFHCTNIAKVESRSKTCFDYAETKRIYTTAGSKYSKFYHTTLWNDKTSHLHSRACKPDITERLAVHGRNEIHGKGIALRRNIISYPSVLL